MTNYSSIVATVNDYCLGCEFRGTSDCSQNCIFNRILACVKTLEASENTAVVMETSNCRLCRDKRGKTKEVFYDDGRGGLSVAEYCPSCGRKI